jgi:amino acid adenylation domain-containing protein
MSAAGLADLARDAAARNPAALAVAGPDGTLSYAELDATADRIASALRELGVMRGDRVAIWAEKSARIVATMQGVLRAGAAYVPIDPNGPAARAAVIARDCGVRALVTTGSRASVLRGQFGPNMPLLLVDDDLPGAEHVVTWKELASFVPAPSGDTRGDSLAYILYTSGSTGQPKGVCISHRNALAFVDWAVAEVAVKANDRLSNHAPFHFDLSVFDLYAAFRAAAAVHIVDEVSASAPRQLAHFVESRAITVWYSVPSALMLLIDRGGWSEKPPSHLRAILFAGEVFPLPHLARLRELQPRARLLNLYGPTETNVCTWYEVTSADSLLAPIPIGRASCGDEVWVRGSEDRVDGIGAEGELMVEGPTVMLGYWGRAPHGAAPYPTGDIVRILADGLYQYVGRRDHMLKIRGHRVEPGEIEAKLHTHPLVREAAVVARGSGPDARLVAFVVPRGSTPPSLVEMKRHLAAQLPRYMIVDDLRVLDTLPRTSNDKVDRLRLVELANAPLR